MSMNPLPTLYKITSTGATQQWSIHVEGSTLVTTYGQLGGKMQVARDLISVGKNIGKANETTPEQQAHLEARSQWEKKLKNRGYVQSLDAATEGAHDEEFVAGGVLPMLAQSYSKHAHKIAFPAYTQPKLDGHRCIAIIKDGVATLWSRTRKPITGVPHINRALEATGLDNIILDGELYNHDYRDRFEELTSFIKRPVPKEGHEAVQYHVYDVVVDAPYAQRYAVLAGLLDTDTIKVVDTQKVNDEDEAMEAFALFTDQGYEGSMLRNAASRYVNKRSYDLQKVKSMEDSEWAVVGVEEGRGKMAGKGIFVCSTPSGATFRVKMKGSLDDLAKYVASPDDYIGRLLTVQYQGLTADGIPRFPIGLRLREDV